MAKKFTTGIDLLNQQVKNLADGSAPGDAVNLAQLDARLRGLDWKNSVRAASTANLTLSGTQSVDGVALAAGNRVLVKDQTTGSNNGVYVVAAGAWARATDYDDNTEITAASAIPVEEGTTNGDAVFILTTDGAITVGTTALAFTRLGGTGTTYTVSATGGLALSGSAFSVKLKAGGGVLTDSDGTYLDASYSGFAKRFSQTLGTATSQTVTHNLGTIDHQVTILDTATGEEVMPDVVHVVGTPNTDTIIFGAAPTAGQYRYTAIG